MSGLGLKAEHLPFKGNPTYPQRMVVHLAPVLVLAALPFLWSEAVVPAVFLLGLLVVSYFLETVVLVEVASLLTPKRDSQNVLGKAVDPSATKRLLFVAHYDSQREGELFNPKNLERMKGFASPNSRITPVHLTFLSVVGLTLTTALFLVDLPGDLVLLQILLHLLLALWILISLGIMLQWMLSPRLVAGANDNASGVAVMLKLAEKYVQKKKDGELEGFELWFLATSCEETGLGGSLAFIKSHEAQLREKETFVLNLDGFGQGKLRYLTADGSLITRPYDPELIAIGDEIATERFPWAGPFVCRLFTDGLAFTARGFRTITFGALDEEDLAIHNYHWRTDIPENIDLECLQRGLDFVEAYVEELLGKEDQNQRQG